MTEEAPRPAPSEPRPAPSAEPSLPTPEMLGIPSGRRRCVLAACWVGLGVVLVAAMAWANLRRLAGDGSLDALNLARLAALLAATLLVVQLALSARLGPLEKVFSLPALLRLHAITGATAATLAALHPIILFAPLGRGPTLSLSNWPILLGLAAWLAVVTVAATSIRRGFFELSFEGWRRIHQLTFVLVAAVGVHSMAIGDDLEGGWPRALWWGLLGAFALLFLWVKVAKPAILRARPWRVASAETVARDTVNVELESEGGSYLEHLPGQFAFLTFRGAAVPAEEHPFTISSRPGRPQRVSFTIKGIGDFTSQLPRVRPGDRATVEGPYGRFSHLLYAGGAEDLLFIAGGIGITPLLSMLRFMAAARTERTATLVWGNRTEGDIPFREEIEGLGERIPGFKVHHVLSEQEDWEGEKGFVTKEVLQRLLTAEELRRRVFLCGPPPMMDSVTKALTALGTPRNRVHTERFRL